MISQQPSKRPWVYNPTTPEPSGPFPGAVSLNTPPNSLKTFFQRNSELPITVGGPQQDAYQVAAENHLLDTYGVSIDQEWETIPDDVLQKILQDPKYYYYIDGPQEGLYVG